MQFRYFSGQNITANTWIFKRSVNLFVWRLDSKWWRALFASKNSVFINKSIENLKIQVIWLAYYLGQTLNSSTYRRPTFNSEIEDIR